MPADVAEIRRSLGILCEAGQVVELRALEVVTPKYPRPHTVSGYFNERDLLAQQVPLLDKAKGIYLTLNPAHEALLSRAMNRLRAVTERDPLTADSDILTRRWLPIDADPVRPSGISSTEAEHEGARVRIEEILIALRERGWPEPILADSGNGAHLLYRVDLPNDEASRDLLRHVLEALAFRFDDPVVTLDQKVFNAARIWKLYGTLTCKGDNTPARPHRVSHILETPEVCDVVSVGLLEALAATLPKVPSAPARHHTDGIQFDLEHWLATYVAGDLIGPRAWQGGQRWIFRVCPWNADHRNRSAFIVQFGSGAIAAGCHHNGCTGHDWHALRAMCEPGWRPYEPPTSKSKVSPNGKPPVVSPCPLSRPVPAHTGLLGIESIQGERLIWVTSAEERAMVQSAGYLACLAVPGVPPFSQNYRGHLGYFRQLEPCLEPIKKHIFLLPNTVDGRGLMAELARRLGPEHCLSVTWPSDCDSIAHVVLIHGTEVLAETIAGAKPLPIRGIVEFASLRESLHDWYHHGGTPRGLSPGWDTLAEIYRVRPGEVTLISGIPSTGKSSFMSAMVIRLCQEYQWPITVFSPEQAPPTRYAVMALEQLSGWPFDEGPSPRMSLNTLNDTLDILDRQITLLWSEDETPTVPYLLGMAKKEVFRRGIKGFCIDPWNEVDHQRAPGEREDQYIGRSLTQIRTFARTYGVHVWIVAHPRLMQKDPKTDKYPVPTPYDISGGAKWRDKADNILALYRDLTGEQSHILQIHTQKIRFRENGQMGRMVELQFDPVTGRYSDAISWGFASNGRPKGARA